MEEPQPPDSPSPRRHRPARKTYGAASEAWLRTASSRLRASSRSECCLYVCLHAAWGMLRGCDFQSVWLGGHDTTSRPACMPVHTFTHMFASCLHIHMFIWRDRQTGSQAHENENGSRVPNFSTVVTHPPASFTFLHSHLQIPFPVLLVNKTSLPDNHIQNISTYMFTIYTRYAAMHTGMMPTTQATLIMRKWPSC